MADTGDEMSKYVTGTFKVVRQEYHMVMIFHNMNISHLMVFDQQIESDKLQGNNKKVKRSSPREGNFSNAKSNG